MEAMSIEEIRKAVGGKIVQGNPSEYIDSISIDSRKIEPGELFIAIIGENYDAHTFIPDAVNKGAGGLIVDRSIKAYPGVAVIRVKDTTEALQDLAAYNRRRYEDLEIIGITGSVGKTTTKDMIASIFSEKEDTLKTEGNYNNYYGLPLTLLSLKGNEKFAVLEMAMSKLGEISKLAEIAAPRIGVVTNVGPAHLKSLKNVANVAKAKEELIKALPEDGTPVLNYDNKYTRKMNEAFRGKKIVYYGLDENADYYATDIKTNEEEKNISFTVITPNNKVKLKLNKPGEHNIYNALAAIAVARIHEISWDKIKIGLNNLNLSSLRLDIRELKELTIINDTYNANPLSMRAGINVLKDIAKKRKIAVLGDMLELGPEEEQAHYELGKLIVNKNIDILITVGVLSKIIASGAKDNGFEKNNIYQCQSNKEVADILQTITQKGDTILLKGSRKMKMEDILKLLQD
ncbi:MAG: UDP-N-acetylmuramoyl-tripeptide--D-alanyl-D-alanine ligase [Halanaerobiales bacterium]